MKKVKPVGGSYCMSDGTTEYNFHFSGGSIDPFDLAAVMQNHLNKSLDVNDFPGYEKVLIHKGNQYNKDMKDNLLPFDLEEAKKDPSRIRYECKEVTDFHVLSNGSLVFLPVGDNYPASVFKSINGDWNYFDLRLTPKRRFVDLYSKDGREFLYGPYNNCSKRDNRVSCNFLGTFELIPVKEDE